jgi:putative membrane protein
MAHNKSKIWFVQIFKLSKKETIATLFPEMLIVALYTLVVTYLEIHYLDQLHVLKNAIPVYSLIGFALSLLLVFRTNTAYDRWWEGRKKWGDIINNSRNFAIKIAGSDANDDDRAYFKRMIPNFVYTLKWHLREEEFEIENDMTTQEAKEFDAAPHKPTQVSKWIYRRLILMVKEGRLTENEYLTVDLNMNDYVASAGACERIKYTPMPFSYNMFLKKFIFIYVFTLPLGFVSTFGYGTILISVFLFYVLVSMEELADEIEDPFGLDEMDLPLDDMCQRVTINVRGILDEE